MRCESVRSLTRGQGQSRYDNPILVIELGVIEGGTLGNARLADVKGDARVAFAAVPVTPITLQIAQPYRELIE